MANCQKLKAVTKKSIQLKLSSLIETTDTIMKAIEKKMITAAVFLDMSRAFDSVNREMIILKLQDIGA